MPVGSAYICPLGSKERWELRAQPLGCNASTLTVLSVFVAVLGTLTLGGMGAILVWFVGRIRHRWKEAEYEGLDPSKWRDLGVLASFVSVFPRWGRSQRRSEVDDDAESAETRPLLE